MAASSLDVLGREDAPATLTVDLVQAGATSSPIVPDLAYDTSMLTLQSPVALSDGHYRLTFKSRNNLALGQYTGSIAFRLCQDAGCASVHPNTTQTLPYRIQVVLGDWATFQRNAAHTGYVGLTVDAAHIAPVWGVYSDDLVGFTRAAADAERAYFGVWGFEGVTRFSGLAAVDLKTGEPRWAKLLDEGSDEVGDPAAAAGQVFIPYAKSGPICCNNPISIHRGNDGEKTGAAMFDSQGGDFLAPVPIGNELMSTSGHYGNVVYNHLQADGALKWQSAGSGYNAWHLETPAVDADTAYHYTGEGLDLFRRSDGVRIKSIADPLNVQRGYDYWGAPMLLPDGTVVAYSGTVSADRADVRFAIHRPLVRFRPATSDIAWRTANGYYNTPATRGGLIFAARNDPALQLDAINISDGSIAWSWTPPDGTVFRSNIVVTDNVLFVSTSQHVYGIDLNDHSVVWSYDAPGALAISAQNLLLVSELQYYSNTSGSEIMRGAPQLVAFRLAQTAGAQMANGMLAAQSLGAETAGGTFPLREIALSPQRTRTH